MSAIKEALLNNVRYASQSNTIDLYEYPDEPDTDERIQELFEEAEALQDSINDR